MVWRGRTYTQCKATNVCERYLLGECNGDLEFLLSESEKTSSLALQNSL